MSHVFFIPIRVHWFISTMWCACGFLPLWRVQKLPSRRLICPTSSKRLESVTSHVWILPSGQEMFFPPAYMTPPGRTKSRAYNPMPPQQSQQGENWKHISSFLSLLFFYSMTTTTVERGCTSNLRSFTTSFPGNVRATPPRGTSTSNTLSFVQFMAMRYFP